MAELNIFGSSKRSCNCSDPGLIKVHSGQMRFLRDMYTLHVYATAPLCFIRHVDTAVLSRLVVPCDSTYYIYTLFTLFYSPYMFFIFYFLPLHFSRSSQGQHSAVFSAADVCILLGGVVGQVSRGVAGIDAVAVSWHVLSIGGCDVFVCARVI